MESAAAASDDLVGEVAAVVFADDSTGFGVVELAADAGDGPRASGPLAGLVPGQAIRLVGRWTAHERHGPTFAAVYYEQARPRSAAGLIAFLSSPRFPGVGPTLAARLVDAFGLDVAEVVTGAPDRLTEVRGVSPPLAEAIAAAWREAGALAALVRILAEVGLPPAVAQAAYRLFGDAAVELLDADPYRLLAVRGARWPHADALARSAGVQPLDDRRLAAGARAAHDQLRTRHGHVAVAADELVGEARRLLAVAAADARRGIGLAADRGDLERDEGPDGQELWYTPADLAAEEGLAAELARLLRGRSRLPATVRARAGAADLAAEQAAAVRAALTSPVSVLTGGPGTGKTRTVVEVVAACEAGDARVALCAPTGRAAKRLEEVTGRPATTIHRLLEARGMPDRGFAFGYDSDRRLPHDMIVADEWSMADTHLAWALVRAVDDGAHLLLVGDADQLPSVGPGAVLRDLLASPRPPETPEAPPLPDASTVEVASTRLTTVHRQAAASRIVTLAHEINAGTVAVRVGRDGDVFSVREQPDRIADRVAEIVAVRAPAFFGCASSDVQVLAPMYRGPAGVDRLNARLKERLNPPRGRRAVAGWHEGDRVAQTRNDAELDVANGDIGEVVAVDGAERTVTVAFPHGTVTYDGERAADLAPAWCLTVHKAQGGEWPVVVLVLDGAHRAMLWRELVYTAVSRAARGLLLVGQPTLLAAAARRTGSGVRSRRTLLAHRLAAAVATGDHVTRPAPAR